MTNWKQQSSRFDKNPAKHVASISIEQGGVENRVWYEFELSVERKGARWFLVFEDFYTEQFPEELGEMSGEEAKHAAKTLAEEAVGRLVDEISHLAETNGTLSRSCQVSSRDREWHEPNPGLLYFRMDSESSGLALLVYGDDSGNWSMQGPFDSGRDDRWVFGKFSSADEARRAASAICLTQARELLAKIREL